MAKISLLALIAVVSSPLYTTAFAPSSSASSFSLQRPGTASSSPLFNTQFDPKLTTTSPSHERRSTTARMMAPAAASATATGASALMGVVSGGILGGALHAIAGPDHLAALLPRCCGQRWYRAGRIGALWGMGHGVSATLLGLTAFGLKNRISSMPQMRGLLIGASSAMEIAVGASLILIGLLGIKEAREFGEEMEEVANADGGDEAVEKAQKRAVVFNGILHGFSWDGAPSLAPAVAVATWKGSISFLIAYALGTMGAMSVTTTLIGESTRRAGEILHRPDLPQKLSFFSSILAMGVGIFWCYLAFK
eukprot:CAMPEP_0204618218 /NCGR_PEP_ID=MMETSP0717-20131115/4943_1 /ASSEMBLY_ACC=CAM_ASM_000666 /TAXON_ID=230516 /ORGANISM="Chaetoceros curvisetus" /LENGTH=307 /DNA_ID=CAMNT_0051631911 /DNA_START=25 /DNA_END=948 /DNA_ORIENTATION=+